MAPRKPKDWHPLLLPIALRPMPAATSGEPFPEWLRRHNDSDNFRRALDALSEIARFGPKKEQFIELLARACVEVCYFASQYRVADDPGVQYRARLAAERKNVAAIADAVANLRKLLAKNPTAAMWARPLGYSLRRRETDAGNEYHDGDANLLAFLMEYESNLRGRLPELHGGPFLDRSTFACLHYEAAREGQQARMPDVAAALLFNLTFLVRKWTAHGTTIYQSGEPMPDGGRPCYAVAAALAAATLGVDGINARTARTRVLALQASGASLLEWPNAK